MNKQIEKEANFTAEEQFYPAVPAEKYLKIIIKVYTTGILGSKEVKKHQQRVIMILYSKNITYIVSDIAEQNHWEWENEKIVVSSPYFILNSNLSLRRIVPKEMFWNLESY